MGTLLVTAEGIWKTLPIDGEQRIDWHRKWIQRLLYWRSDVTPEGSAAIPYCPSNPRLHELSNNMFKQSSLSPSQLNIKYVHSTTYSCYNVQPTLTSNTGTTSSVATSPGLDPVISHWYIYQIHPPLNILLFCPLLNLPCHTPSTPSSKSNNPSLIEPTAPILLVTYPPVTMIYDIVQYNTIFTVL